MIFGYARVSTIGQDLQAQLDALTNEGCQMENIYKEKFTGTTTHRPQLDALLDRLQEGDKLIVTKLDRLARNTKEGIEIVDAMFKKGVRVHVLNVGLLENTTMGRFFLQTMLAVAEMERNLILERTKEGKAIAKQKPDFKEGRPRKYKREQVEHALSLLEKYSYTQVEQMTGISKATLVRRARERREAERKEVL
jgi:DNA invertase Pin-like site-specific DNA recombinase